jgi:hypothetical protein
MNPKLCLLLINLSLSIFSEAQIGYRMLMGGRNASLAGCGIAILDDASAVFYNPASLTQLSSNGAIVAANRRLGVSNLKPIGIGFVLPTQSGVFGLSVQHLSFDVVQQQKIGVGFGRRLMENLSLGVQLDYSRWAVDDYPTAHILTVELGCNVQVFKELTLSTHVFNPIRVRLSGGERTPSVFQVGAAWQALPNFLLTAEAEQSTHNRASGRLGLEYRPVAALATRLGFGVNPAVVSVGVGYRLGAHLAVDVAVYQHLILGATPAASLVYDFGDAKKRGRIPPQ